MFKSLCISHWSSFFMQTPPTTTVIRSLLRQHSGVQLAVMISCKHHLRGVGAQTACKGTLITVSLPCEIIHCTIIYSSVTEDLKHWLWLLKKSPCRKRDVCVTVICSFSHAALYFITCQLVFYGFSYAFQGCIYLSQNTVKLWNIITI